MHLLKYPPAPTSQSQQGHVVAGGFLGCLCLFYFSKTLSTSFMGCLLHQCSLSRMSVWCITQNEFVQLCVCMYLGVGVEPIIKYAIIICSISLKHFHGCTQTAVCTVGTWITLQRTGPVGGWTGLSKWRTSPGALSYSRARPVAEIF